MRHFIYLESGFRSDYFIVYYFPVLKKAINTNLWGAVALVVAGYIIGLVICSKIALVPATILLVRLPEFAFGMIFVKLNWRQTGKYRY